MAKKTELEKTAPMEENQTEQNTEPKETSGDKKIPFLRKLTPYDQGGLPGQITLVLRNGTKITVRKDEVSTANIERAFWHGISQKLGDCVSGLSKDNLYNLAEKEIRAIAETLKSPNWDKNRVSGKIETEQDISDLVDAIAMVKNLDRDLVDEAARKMSREQRDTYRQAPSVITALKEIELNRLKTIAVSAPEFEFPVK